MARTATSEIKLVFNSTIKNTLPDNRTPTMSIAQDVISGQIETGVQANQANRAWENKSIEISSGNTLDIDLYDFAAQDIGAGAGRDGLGQLLVVEEIVCLVIKQASGSGRLEIQPAGATNPVAWIPANFATVANGGALRTGGVRMWFESDEAGLDITDASSHILRLGANGGDVVADIWVLGRHDDDDSSSSSSSSSSSCSSGSSSSSVSSSSSSTLSSSCST